jgi:hypothetical protein
VKTGLVSNIRVDRVAVRQPGCRGEGNVQVRAAVKARAAIPLEAGVGK